MKVILLQDIAGTGKKNTIVDSKEGYARNFLIPNNLALEANEKNLKKLEDDNKRLMNQEKKEKDDAQKLATNLSSLKCILKSKAGDSDRLFGSITNQDIHKFLETKGYHIDKKDIHIIEPIKTLGTYTAEVRLHKDVKAKLTIQIEKL